MKTYYDEQSLRIAGKAWQVRCKLQMLLKTMRAGTTVSELLNRMHRPVRVPAPVFRQQASAAGSLPKLRLIKSIEMFTSPLPPV